MLAPGRQNLSAAVHSIALRRQVISSRSNRIVMAVVFAVLWTGGMLWEAPSIDLQNVVTAVIAGALAGGLMAWLFGKLSGGFRG